LLHGHLVACFPLIENGTRRAGFFLSFFFCFNSPHSYVSAPYDFSAPIFAPEKQSSLFCPNRIDRGVDVCGFSESFPFSPLTLFSPPEHPRRDTSGIFVLATFSSSETRLPCSAVETEPCITLLLPFPLTDFPLDPSSYSRVDRSCAPPLLCAYLVFCFRGFPLGFAPPSSLP